MGGWDNIIFYSDVRVPDRYRIGEVNNGWSVLRRPLDAEHHLGSPASKLADVSGGIHHMRYFEQSVQAAVRWAQGAPAGDGSTLISDPEFLAGIGRLLVEAEAGTVTPGPMGRVKGSDVAREGCEQLIDLVGPAAALPYGADGAISDGVIAFAHRQAQQTATAGGSVEVFRTMIAQNDLGLPRPDYRRPQGGYPASTACRPSRRPRIGSGRLAEVHACGEAVQQRLKTTFELAGQRGFGHRRPGRFPAGAAAFAP